MPWLDRRDLVLLALLAFAVRLGAVLLWTPEPTGDATDYLRLAEALARGEGFVNTDGFPTSWRPPLYPAFLAPFVALWPTKVDGRALAAAGVVQAVLSTASVLLVYVMGRAWFGRSVGLLSGVLSAVSFAQVAAVPRILSETLFVTMFLGALALLTAGESATPRRATRPARWWSPGTMYFLSGACFGLASLVRSVLFPFPFILAGCMIVRAFARGPRVERAGLTRPLLMVAGFVLILGPWTIRNHRVHGTLVPVATQVGETLYAGNHPTDGYILGVLADDSRTDAAREMTEVGASRFLTRMTIRDWRRDPAAVPRLIALKLLYFWTPADWELLPGSGAFNPTYMFVVIWAGLAAAITVTRPPGERTIRAAGGEADSIGLWEAWTLWAPVLYFLIVAVVFYGSPRLRMPAEPLLSIAAALGMIRAHAAFGGRRSTFAIAGAAVFVMALGATWDRVEAAVRASVMTWGAG